MCVMLTDKIGFQLVESMVGEEDRENKLDLKCFITIVMMEI